MGYYTHVILNEARQRQSWLETKMEALMALATNTAASVQTLFDAVNAAETEIDAKAAIIASQTAILTDVVAQLAAVAAHPVPSSEAIQTVIDGLNTHIAGLSTSVDTLVAADPAPAPAPAPAPVADPGAAPVAITAAVVTTDPAPVA